MERFYAEPEAFGQGEAKITGGEFQHLKKVLRLMPGDRAEVFDGAGRGFIGRLISVGETEAIFSLDEPVTQKRDSSLNVCLAQGIPKGEKMEWVVQKATELGVAAILPLELSRCVVRLENDKKRRERRSRWQKVAREAARQCGRLTAPEVMAPMDLAAFLRQIRPPELLLIPWEEGGQALGAFFQEAGPSWQKEKIYMMIGPEGGMSEKEVEQGRRAGGRVLTLGPRILRTETAGLMLLSVLQYQWGDAGGRIE
jgi:16S rRNA (uracil1498-N3)-methyltransferase